MQNLFEILKQNKTVTKVVDKNHTPQKIKAIWSEVFSTLATQLKFSYYQKGVLTIQSDNPVWVTEIGYYEKEFITKINSALGSDEVKKIVVRSSKTIIDGDSLFSSIRD
jgi:Protein of unknown function (DUF721).